jgi:hypothetical protein
MITSIDHPSLRCLLRDESDFIDAAFHCVLPEARDEGVRVSASAYVDAKLAALLAQGRPESFVDLRSYRAGIARVQALCERRHGRRFQVFRSGSSCPSSRRSKPPKMLLRACSAVLLDLLLNDAAEAYFDAVGPSWAQAHEAVRIAAA